MERTFTVEQRPDLLGGVAIVHGKGMRLEESNPSDALYRFDQPIEKEVEITAIPYCVWDNRAPGEMRVWLRTR